MVLTLVVWLGGVIFLAFVEAPTVFAPGFLPSRQLAGSVVGRTLDVLHYMAIASGVIFLLASMLHSRLITGVPRAFASRHLLIGLMLLITLLSQFVITPKLHAIRADAGAIDNVAGDDPRRAQFDRLHSLSEKFEGAVLLIGLVALYSTAQALRE